MAEVYQHIGVEELGGTLVLKVKDEKVDDWDLAQQIKADLIDAAGKSNDPNVIVDLRNVTFLSSVGYLPFLSLRRQVQMRSGRIVLCHMAPLVKETFSVTRMLINPSSRTSTFEWAPTCDDARALLES